MVLKAELDKLEDAPQAAREHYKKIDGLEGKVSYRLDVEKVGNLELTDASGLISSLQKERQSGIKLAKFGTLTPEEATANVAKIAELEAQVEQFKSKGGKLSESERTQLTTELGRVHKEEIAKEKALSTARLAEVIRLRKDDAAEAALIAVGFKGSACKLMKPLLVAELDVVEDETATKPENRFRTVVRDAERVERITSDKDQSGRDVTRPMAPLDRAKEFARDKEFKGYLTVEKPEQKPGDQRQPAPSNGYQPAIPSANPDQPNSPAGRVVANPMAQPIAKLNAAFARSKPVAAQ